MLNNVKISSFSHTNTHTQCNIHILFYFFFHQLENCLRSIESYQRWYSRLIFEIISLQQFYSQVNLTYFFINTLNIKRKKTSLNTLDIWKISSSSSPYTTKFAEYSHSDMMKSGNIIYTTFKYMLLFFKMTTPSSSSSSYLLLL